MRMHSAVPFTVAVAFGLALLPGCKKAAPSAAPSGSASAAAAATTTPAAALLSALQNFEGEVDLVASSPKEKKPPSAIALLVKGKKLRFDLPNDLESGPKLGKNGYVVVDTANKKLTAVMDEKKQAMVLSFDTLGQQLKQFQAPAERAEPANTNATPPKITKTGHTDTVAGRTCEDWDVASADGERGRVCVANEGASWLNLPTLGLPANEAWAHELFDGAHVPLRFIGYDKAGAEDGRLEVTKIEKKTIADTEFEVPAGYKTLDVGEMMRGMMGGMAGRTPGAPGAVPAPSGTPPGFSLPPGVKLPPGVTLPPGVKLPPGVTLPANAAALMKQMQDRARAAGVKPPPQ